MTRKGISIQKTVYEQLLSLKKDGKERTTTLIKRLLDKYEEELMNNGE